jgi:hypothetical protein
VAEGDALMWEDFGTINSPAAFAAFVRKDYDR